MHLAMDIMEIFYFQKNHKSLTSVLMIAASVKKTKDTLNQEEEFN